MKNWLTSFFILALLQITSSQKLSSYNINSTQITTSGVSSGAAFAIQIQVAYSAIFAGVAILAGPPYYCAGGDVEVALTACMSDPDLISVDALWAATDYAYTLSSIDDPANLKQRKVWILSGMNDTVVEQGVVRKTQAYFAGYTPMVETVYNLPAEHSWVTASFGNKCDFLGTPYINNCNFDSAQKLLQMFYGALSPKVQPLSQNLFPFSQENYTPLNVKPSDISMDQIGYVYVPTACQKGQMCKLHFAFHGCLQGQTIIGKKFIENVGLNNWAESNNMIVVYPQVLEKDVPVFNPKGCWDWWGYTGEDYASQLGAQMITVKNMLDALMGTNKKGVSLK